MPAMYLADLLKCHYSIYFAITNDILKELVEKNGFKAIFQSRWRVMLGMERDYIVTEKKQYGNFWNLVKAIRKNEVFEHRQKELKGLIESLKPHAVIIDIFSSTDYLVLKSLGFRLKLLFFNPMLSTYRVSGYPLVSEGTWIKSEVKTEDKSKKHFLNFLRRPKGSILHYLVTRQTKNNLKKGDVSEADFDKENSFTKMFKRVPELVTAPLELEVSPNVRQENQYYLGLSTRNHRIETELDNSFIKVWGNILSIKHKIVYCSFGTFYSGPDRALLNFLHNLFEAIKEMDSTQLVISVNRYVIEAVKNDSISNVHLFTKVPQLEVLKSADVFITHGGLGSIKGSN